MANKLYYGDNLDILRRYIKDESVDLIYLDPPFKSGQNYNILFEEKNGTASKAQIEAFEDTWHWDMTAENIYVEIVEKGSKKVADFIKAIRAFLGANDMMAYLVMMAIRLVELHRALNQTGSIYLHCDPTASHYLKILMDAIFGAGNFRNEIIWQRKTSSASKKSIANTHDVILRYSKSEKVIFNPQFVKYSDEYVKQQYTHKDDKGIYRIHDVVANPALGGSSPRYKYKGYIPNTRWLMSKDKLEKLDKEEKLYWAKSGKPYRKLYLNEMSGEPVSDIWADIPIASGNERMGYQTQKPEKLLERIINTSSNKGDIVLDPFCGCGTTIISTQKLKRKWIGIDVTHLAIHLIKQRLRDTFGGHIKYTVIGEPKDLEGAEELADKDRYQFQWWALGLVGARPAEKEQKKGKDTGIDGYIYFHDEGESKKTKTIIFQVKSGHIGAKDIRDLRGVIDRQKAEIGVFITLKSATRDMKKEAVTAGFYNSPWGNNKYPKLQIITIENLLQGKTIESPPLTQTSVTFKKAEKYVEDKGEKQLEMEI